VKQLGYIGTQRRPVATSPNTQVPFDGIVRYYWPVAKSQFAEKDKFEVSPDCLQLVELESPSSRTFATPFHHADRHASAERFLIPAQVSTLIIMSHRSILICG
jgi:hypothetical protein